MYSLEHHGISFIMFFLLNHKEFEPLQDFEHGHTHERKREIAVVNRPEFSQMRFPKKPQDAPLGRSVLEVLRAEFVRNRW